MHLPASPFLLMVIAGYAAFMIALAWTSLRLWIGDRGRDRSSD